MDWVSRWEQLTPCNKVNRFQRLTLQAQTDVGSGLGQSLGMTYAL